MINMHIFMLGIAMYFYKSIFTLSFNNFMGAFFCFYLMEQLAFVSVYRITSCSLQNLVPGKLFLFHYRDFFETVSKLFTWCENYY